MPMRLLNTWFLIEAARPEFSLTPRTTGTNGMLLDRMLRHRHFLLRVENGIARDVAAPIKDALREINGLFKGGGLTAYREGRLNEIGGRLEALLGVAQADAQDVLAGKLRQAQAREHNLLGRLLRGTIPTSVPLDLGGPSPAAIERMILGPLGGVRWEARMRENFGQALGKMQRSLALSTALGEGADKAARRMRKAGLNLTLQRSRLIARTETQRVANEILMDKYTRNRHIIQGVQALETLDARTCLVCASIDGDTWPLNDPNLPTWPIHPGCRGLPLMIVLSADDLHEMGLIDKEAIPPSHRTSLTGNVPQKTNYDTWIRAQPEAFQEEILLPMMGRTRYEAFKAGRLTLKGMVKDHRVIALRNMPTGDFPLAGEPEVGRVVDDGLGLEAEEARQAMLVIDQEIGPEYVRLRAKYQKQIDDLFFEAKQITPDNPRGFTRWTPALQRRLTRTEKARDRAYDKNAARRNKILFVPEGQRTKFLLEHKGAKRVPQWEITQYNLKFLKTKERRKATDAGEFWESMTSLDMSQKRPVQWLGGQPRATYTPEKESPFGRRGGQPVYYGRVVKVARVEEERTFVHELGHYFEQFQPETAKKAIAWRGRRTKGEKNEWLGPGYETNEVTKKDRFRNKYIGKDYGPDNSEVISMGVEALFVEPADFAREDPDHFKFIYDLLRGRDTSKYGTFEEP